MYTAISFIMIHNCIKFDQIHVVIFKFYPRQCKFQPTNRQTLPQSDFNKRLDINKV